MIQEESYNAPGTFVPYVFKPFVQATGATLQDAGVGLLASTPGAVGGMMALAGWKNNPLSTGAQYMRENLRSQYGKEVAKQGDNWAYQGLEFIPTALAGTGVANAVSKIPQVTSKVAPLVAGVGTEAAISAGQEYANSDSSWVNTVPYVFTTGFLQNSVGAFGSRFIPKFSRKINVNSNTESWLDEDSVIAAANRGSKKALMRIRTGQIDSAQMNPVWQSMTLGELGENIPPELMQLIGRYLPAPVYAEEYIPGD